MVPIVLAGTLLNVPNPEKLRGTRTVLSIRALDRKYASF